MKVLVTFAVEAEFAPWRRLRGFERLALQPKPVYRATIASAEVRVVLTGIRARPLGVTESLARAFGPDVCIAAGFAGALKPGHRTGDVLAARVVRGLDGAGVVPGNPDLLELAAGCGAKIVESFAATDRVILRAREKTALGASADAVDMESFPILTEMCALGVSAIAVRAIADTVEEDLPLDFNRAVSGDGQVRLASVFTQLLSAPHRLPGLLRLRSETRRSAHRLAAFLDSLVAALAQEKRAMPMLSEVAAG